MADTWTQAINDKKKKDSDIIQHTIISCNETARLTKDNHIYAAYLDFSVAFVLTWYCDFKTVTKSTQQI